MVSNLASPVRLITQQHNQTGESPVWCDRQSALFWVDIPNGSIYRWFATSGVVCSWRIPGPIGAIALTKTGHILAATKSGFVLLDTELGTAAPFGDLPTLAVFQRYNDGKVGPDGAFWVGGADERIEKEPCCSLFRLDPSGRVTAAGPTDLVMSNGLAWSPAGDVMIHSDSRRRLIWKYTFDKATGTIGPREIMAEPLPEVGAPDGAAMDVDGYYWSCGIGAGRVNRYSPEGDLVEHIAVPVSQPTMCCFGGPDLQTMYITTMGARLSANELKDMPWSGGVLAIPMQVAGVPVHRFGI